MTITAAAAPTPTTKIYRVAERHLPALRAAIDRLAKRADRLGVEPIGVAVGEPVALPFLRSETGRLVAWTDRAGLTLAAAERSGMITYVRFVDVAIAGAAPRLAGWAFAATLQHVDGEGGERLTMLRAAPALEHDLPAKYRTASPEDCDHCRRRIRTRRETFVLSHSDGRWAQVGRNCTQDFLGGVDPHAVAGALDMLLELHTTARGYADDDGYYGGGYVADVWPVRQFLTVTAALVRVDGWVSRGVARARDLQATADAALDYLTPPPAGSKAHRDWATWTAARPIVDADGATADAAIDHVRGTLAERDATDATNDYEHNLVTACKLAAVDRKLAGIVASLISYYKRDVAARVERAAAPVSQHVGAVGDKIVIRLTLSRVQPLDGAYESHLHTFVDAAGNIVKWFASSKGDLVEGESYLCAATVKKLDNYRGQAQTVVTRLTVTTQAAVDAAAAAAAAKAERAAQRAARAAQRAAGARA